MPHQSTETEPTTSAATKPPPAAKHPTKTAQLIKLLSRKSGADVDTISVKFGWQPHTTRAALSGLRKIGLDLIKESGTSGKATRYRIVTGSSGETAADAPNAQ
jgi:hypothetical protein